MLNRMQTPLSACSLKFDASNTQIGRFAGYASVFGGVDSYGDTIVKGAFAESLANMKRLPLMLYGHRSSDVVGKWTDIKEDDIGLWTEGEFTPDHTLAKDVYASMKHGAIDGLSIGFMIPAGGSEELKEGGRRLKQIDLIEVSIVGFPADDGARVAQVKMSDEIKAIETIRDAERFLRDAGLPVSMAKAFLSQLKPLFQREVEAETQRKEAYQADLNWLHNLIEKGMKQ